LSELAVISRKGPLKSVGKGSPGIGLTLLHHLGIDYQSSKKPRKYGVVVSARRGSKIKDPHRVNLFSAVADWDLSELKSSSEILQKAGYARGGAHRLNCTVDSRQPNAQGLQLKVNRELSLLEEWLHADNFHQNIAVWRMDRLKKKLAEAHPETIWVTAQVSEESGFERFHYRYATVSSAAKVDDLPDLLAEGTVTMDHLITNSSGRTIEKGPLFKLRPKNLPLLFPQNELFDLLQA